MHTGNTHCILCYKILCRIYWIHCLENKGRLQDCSCSIGSYHCIQCYAHILWAATTGQTDLSLSHWVHFTVLRCICVFVFSCISLHACCIIVTWWGGPGGIEWWVWWLTILLQCFDTVGWVTWPVKISSPNDLYCVEWDVKPYSTQLSVAWGTWSGVPRDGWDSFLCLFLSFQVCVLFRFFVSDCRYQCNWLPEETRLWNDRLCVEWDVKPYTLISLLSCQYWSGVSVVSVVML